MNQGQGLLESDNIAVPDPDIFLFKVDGKGGYLKIYQTINAGYPYNTDNSDDQMENYSPASEIMGTDNGY